LEERAKLGEIFKPGDASQRQLDEEAAVRTASQPLAVLGQDLESGHDRVERPPGDDLAESGPLPGSHGKEQRIRSGGQNHRIAHELDQAAE
jgi:hypothetical protein